MANKKLFRSIVGKLIPAASAYNHEGAPAYAFEPRHALAQYAATGCLNGTFYASGEQQLDTVLALSRQVSAECIARTAVYCRERGHMKDMPALLCAVVARSVAVTIRTRLAFLSSVSASATARAAGAV